MYIKVSNLVIGTWKFWNQDFWSIPRSLLSHKALWTFFPDLSLPECLYCVDHSLWEAVSRDWWVCFLSSFPMWMLNCLFFSDMSDTSAQVRFSMLLYGLRGLSLCSDRQMHVHFPNLPIVDDYAIIARTLKGLIAKTHSIYIHSWVSFLSI